MESKKLNFLEFIKTLKDLDNPLGDLSSDILRDKKLFKNSKCEQFNCSDKLIIRKIYWKINEINVKKAYYNLVHRFLVQKFIYTTDLPMYIEYFEDIEDLL